MSRITEGVVEDTCLDFLADLGYEVLHGPDIGPGGVAQERSSWDQVVLTERLRSAVARINPKLPASSVDLVVAQVLRPESQSAVAENYRLHRLATEGVAVEYAEKVVEGAA